MMFSSSLSVVFYFLHRFPIPFAGYLIFISILAGFWGQCLVRKIVHALKRASLIVFILSSVIFASALTMGVVGTQEHFDDQQPRIHGVPRLLRVTQHNIRLPRHQGEPRPIPN